MVTPDLRRYRYCVDATDRIIWVDSWWLAFARENGASELTADSVIGHSLWDFVSGADTRRLFTAIHERVRSSGAPAVLPFRCDSPSLQRHMRLTISREVRGSNCFTIAFLLRVEPQVLLTVLDDRRPRSDAFLTMCSCCKRSLLEPVAGWMWTRYPYGYGSSTYRRSDNCTTRSVPSARRRPSHPTTTERPPRSAVVLPAAGLSLDR